MASFQAFFFFLFRRSNPIGRCVRACSETHLSAPKDLMILPRAPQNSREWPKIRPKHAQTIAEGIDRTRCQGCNSAAAWHSHHLS